MIKKTIVALAVIIFAVMQFSCDDNSRSLSSSEQQQISAIQQQTSSSQQGTTGSSCTVPDEYMRDDWIPGEVAVYVYPWVTDEDVEKLAQEYDLTLVYRHRPTLNYDFIFDPSRPVNDVIRQLYCDPRVEDVGGGIWGQITAQPNDPGFSNQWGLTKIQATQAWDIEQGDPGIIVAVLDTGIDLNHSDLQSNIWTNTGETPANGKDDDKNGYKDDVDGWNFIPQPGAPGGTANVQDDNGHGTHIAGIISAVTNNGIGVAGVSWNSRLMTVKVARADRSTDQLWVKRGIEYAADNGANIINLSLRFLDDPAPFQLKKAVEYARGRGCVVIAAMGDDGFTRQPNPPHYTPVYPAYYPGVLAVGAVDALDQRWTDPNTNKGSNVGWWIDVCAPGVDIYSTQWGGGYTYMSGTSMATAFASGLAALILSRNPNLTPIEVISIIWDTTDKIYTPAGNLARSDEYGSGRINAYKALIATPLQPTPGGSVQAGLNWLRDVQNVHYDPTHPDFGSWGYSDGRDNPSIGITALATLAFLNAGVPVTDVDVDAGLTYLTNHAQADGSINGEIAGRETTRVYETSCAIMALVAAKLAGRKGLDNIITGARNYLLNTQFTDGIQHGGWGYPRAGWADLSNTQFAALALRVSDLPVSLSGFDATSLNALTTYLTNNKFDNGGFAYRATLGGWSTSPYGSMTAAGMWSAFAIEIPKTNSMIQNAMSWFNSYYSYTDNPGLPGAWYYYYLWTASKAFEMYDFKPQENNWYENFFDYLVLNTASPYRQSTTDGSWPSGYGTPKVMATALAVLTLEIRQSIFHGQLRFLLGSGARLHVYDPDGRHVGYNPVTGQIDLEIPHAEYIGSPDTEQEIIIHKHFKPGAYKIVIEAIHSNTYTLTVEGYYNEELVSRESYNGKILAGEKQEWLANVATIITPVTVDVNFPPNKLPVANAGGPYKARTKDVFVNIDPDTLNRQSEGRWITAYLTRRVDGKADAILDGSSSYDPDGDTFTYQWSIYDSAGSLVAEAKGVNPVIEELSPGEYNIKLIVNDGKIYSDPATTSIKVELLDLRLLVDKGDRLLPEVNIFLNGAARDWGELQEGNILMVKFPRDAVIKTVAQGERVKMMISGDVRGEDFIRVIK